MNKSSPAEGLNVGNIEDYAMNAVFFVSSIVTAPIEIFLRPWYGSTYFNAVTQSLALMMLIVMTAFSGVAGMVGHFVPGMRMASGMYGLGEFTELYLLASFVHGFRIWRRMLHPEKEMVSYFEGPPLPFFPLLPGGKSFWRVRVIYEPIFLAVLSILLSNLFITQPSLTFYLRMAALFLFMKNYVSWYGNWHYLRKTMDMANIGPVIGEIVNNTATEEEKATVHLASLPSDLPDDLRKATAERLAPSFSKDTK